MNAALLAGLVSAGTSLVVCTAAFGVSRGRLHRTDRVGAAAVAVGFVAGYQLVTGGGWHPERPVTWLPMIVVVGALIGPRLAGRLAPEAPVPPIARVFVLLAALGAAIAMLGVGRTEAAALELAVLGAAVGAALGERLGDDSGETGLLRPDRRVGAWVVAALVLGLVPVLGA